MQLRSGKYAKAAFVALLCLSSAACFAAAAYTLSSVLDAIRKTESGGNELAINDNTTRRSYTFRTKAEAVKMADYLMSLNHNIDMGDYQVNSIQIRRGWTTSQLFESNFSRKAAETIFGEWLALARKKYGDTTLAWQRAIGGYNSGFHGLNNGKPVYTTKVLRNLGMSEAPMDHDTATAGLPRPEKLGLGDDDEEDEEMWEPTKKSGAKAAKAFDELALGAMGGLFMVLLALVIPILGIKGSALLFGGARKAASKTREMASNASN